MTRHRKKGISIPLTVFISLLLLLLGGAGGYTLYIKALVTSPYQAINQHHLETMDGINLTIASLFASPSDSNDVQLNETQQPTVKEDIEVVHVSGETYQGKMMIVHDPKLVTIAVNPTLDSYGEGLTLQQYIELEDGIAGTNAGGFEDAGGHGNGGQAWGIVIKDGELISGNLNDYTTVIGMNENHDLICQDMSAQQALDWGIQEGITFGPVLVNEYADAFTRGGQAQLNPRTVIGQRYDGAYLLFVAEGRQPYSFGTTYQDLVEVMLSFGARTAACLDGGNSSLMIYENQEIAAPVAIWGSRNLPTAIVVKKGA